MNDMAYSAWGSMMSENEKSNEIVICEYCEKSPADGIASNGASVCMECYEDHHGLIL